VTFGETRMLAAYELEQLALILREARRDLADAARAVAVGGKEALNAKQD
jgi:hypothetical protein